MFIGYIVIIIAVIGFYLIYRSIVLNRLDKVGEQLSQSKMYRIQAVEVNFLISTSQRTVSGSYFKTATLFLSDNELIFLARPKWIIPFFTEEFPIVISKDKQKTNYTLNLFNTFRMKRFIALKNKCYFSVLKNQNLDIKLEISITLESSEDFNRLGIVRDWLV